MTPRLSWIAFGILFIIISSQNVFSKKPHHLKNKDRTVSPLKKSTIGNFDLKTSSKHVKAEQCRNRKPSSLCIKMIKRDKDICLINRQFMSDNCKLTCRFCSPYNKVQKKKVEKECKDHHLKCRKWAKDNDCLHYSVFMLDVCKKSCEICGEDFPSLTDTDERCPKWGKTGFCEIKKQEMDKLCPYSCKKYAKRRYIVKYAKPPKRRSPRPTVKPKPTKPTPRPTPPLSEDEKEDLREASEEYAEEEETRLREREEQRKEKEEGKVTPLQAPPVLRSERPDLESQLSLDDIDVPSEYEGGTRPSVN